MEEVVWLHEYRCFAWLSARHASFSLVWWYNEFGEKVEALVENDDYDLWEERAIEYDTDDGS